MSQHGEFRQGYPTLIAAFIGLGLGVSGVPLYTFGYFVLPLMERYDLSRTEVSAWVSAYTATVLVAAPLVGRLVDRFGGRAVACTSFIALAGAYAYCAAADSGRVVLYSTAMAVALLGSGTLPGTFTKAVATWFVASRGLAFGISMCGVLAGVTIASYIVPWMIEYRNVSQAYLSLAALALVAIIPVGLLLREKTEQPTHEGHSPFGGLTVQAAVRQPVFTLLCLSFFSFCLASTAVVLHLVPWLTESGVQLTDTSLYIVMLSAGGLVGRILIGLLIDRIFAPAVIVSVFVLASLSCLSLLWVTPTAALVSAFIIGFSIGAEVDLIAYLTARYFGLRAYGAIYGLLYAAFALGSALGPVGAAWLRDLSGDYDLPFACAAVSALISALILIPVARTQPYVPNPTTTHEASPLDATA